MKKFCIIITALLVLCGAFVLVIKITSFSDIYPKALDINLNKKYKLFDLKISEEKAYNALKNILYKYYEKNDIDEKDNISGVISLDNNINKDGNNGLSIMSKDVDYNIMIYKKSYVEKKYHLKKQSNNLKEYSFYNMIYIPENEYVDKGKIKRETRNYYDRERFIKKAKVEKKKYNKFIIYPTAYFSPMTIGTDVDYYYSFFKFKYGQKMLIFQDDIVIEIKTVSNKKEDLMSKTIDFANDILTQFHKASEDENYEMNLDKYKEE